MQAALACGALPGIPVAAHAALAALGISHPASSNTSAAGSLVCWVVWEGLEEGFTGQARGRSEEEACYRAQRCRKTWDTRCGGCQVGT